MLYCCVFIAADMSTTATGELFGVDITIGGRDFYKSRIQGSEVT